MVSVIVIHNTLMISFLCVVLPTVFEYLHHTILVAVFAVDRLQARFLLVIG